MIHILSLQLAERTYCMLVLACDTQIRGPLDSTTKSFGQHSAWFYRWWYLFTSAVHRTSFYHDIRQSKQMFPESVVCPAQTWCWRGRMRGDGGTEEKDGCFLSCHIPPPPPVSYGGRVMNILHCKFWHSPYIHLVSWQKCTPGTHRCPAPAPQERLLSSTALTSHALLKSLVKDGHG